MKIATIIGARPQFIKAAVVSRVFREQQPDVREVLIHTDQHYDANLSDVFFEEMDIPQPDYHRRLGYTQEAMDLMLRPKQRALAHGGDFTLLWHTKARVPRPPR